MCTRAARAPTAKAASSCASGPGRMQSVGSFEHSLAVLRDLLCSEALSFVSHSAAASQQAHEGRFSAKALV